MIHTANLTLLASVTLLGSALGSRPQDDIGKPTQDHDIKKVIDDLKAREKALKSVTMDMSTWGSYPSNLRVETEGKLRVLGTTHFHIDVTTKLGSTQARMDKVITPAGVWTHEDGPLENVYTFMEPALMAELREAQTGLAADRQGSMRNPGPLAANGEAPLGSVMLEVMNQQFELKVDPKPVMVDGVPCKLLAGVWRGFSGLEPDVIPDWNAALDIRAVHRVEIFIRVEDGIPIRTIQYNKTVDEATKEFADVKSLEINIKNLKLNPKLQESDFKLDIPEGTTVRPVMEHDVSRAQITRIRDEWEALKKKKAEAAKKNGKGGKGGDTPR